MPVATHRCQIHRVLAMLALLGANGCASPSNNCTGPTSFLVFQTAAPTSAIPVCNDVADAGLPSQSIGPTLTIDGAAGYPFSGAPHLSRAALAQCALVCAQTAFSIPCCQSQWEPDTVVCEPACQ